MGVELGEEVGYAIRFEDCTSKKTVVKYMTGNESNLYIITYLVVECFYISPVPDLISKIGW